METEFTRERRSLAERQNKARAAENERIREARLAAIDAERAAKADDARQRAEAALRAQLRDDFLGANPMATQKDFETAYPELRLEHLKREAIEGPAREKRAARERIPVDMRF